MNKLNSSAYCDSLISFLVLPSSTKKNKPSLRRLVSFGRGRRTLFSTIESSTGAFSQIFPAASCTKNLEFRFKSCHSDSKKQGIQKDTLFFGRSVRSNKKEYCVFRRFVRLLVGKWLTFRQQENYFTVMTSRQSKSARTSRL